MPAPKPGESPSRVLARHGLAPRKSLGQSFLRDRAFLTRIAQAADLRPSDVILEVGPGTGSLTRTLAESGASVLAVELDTSLLALLEREMSHLSGVDLKQGNALYFDPCAEIGGPYKLVANIPYYITGPLIRHFLEVRCPPLLMVLMVQREVADRIVARPGGMSLLAVSVQYYASVEKLFTVPASAFYPRPKVDSAVIRITPHTRPVRATEAAHFFRVVRAGFTQRRKQLGNTIANGLGLTRETASGYLRASRIDPTRRAESLSIEEWERLAAAVPETGHDGTS